MSTRMTLFPFSRLFLLCRRRRRSSYRCFLHLFVLEGLPVTQLRLCRPGDSPPSTFQGVEVKRLLRPSLFFKEDLANLQAIMPRATSTTATVVVSRPARERTTQATRTYYDDDDSEDASGKDDQDSDFNADGASSGSEYGKKKKSTPAKRKTSGKVAKRGSAKASSARGAKKKGASAGKKSPAKKGSPKKGGRTSASKSRRAANTSDEDDEVSSLEEEDSEFTNSDDSSGSEYGKKKKKKPAKKTPTRKQPKRTTSSPKKRTGKKKRDLSSDEEEEEEPEHDSKTSKNGTSKKKLKLDPKVSEEEDEDEDMEKDEVDVKAKPKAKSEDEVDEDDDSEEEEEKAPSKSKPTPAEKVKPEKEKDTDDAAAESEKATKDSKELKNRSETDLESLTFEPERKGENGASYTHKIASWNVAGLRAIVAKKGLDYILAESPNVFCLQETKVGEETIPAEIKEKISNEYPHIYWAHSTSPGSNGICTLAKVEPVRVEIGFPVAESDSEEDASLKKKFNDEGRLILTEFEGFNLINAYVPNGGRAVKGEGQKKAYPPRVTSGERGDWDRLLTAYIQELEKTKPVILAGDLNVAHEPIDLANPKTNASSAGFTQEERDGFSTLLEKTGLIDTFRHLYPEKQAYTFWSYLGGARARNIGWRLDYFCVSKQLLENVWDNSIRDQVFGSDHAPVIIYLKL